MSEIRFFKTGDQVTVREIWAGSVWSARPMRVVQDTPEMLALYMSPGTRWKQPKNHQGERVTATDRREENWRLTDAIWEDQGILRLTIPGSMYSVLLFWHKNYSALRAWYINLEESLYRTSVGFEYMDQILDVVVAPDLSDWYWKDEDDFKEAQRLLLISQEKAVALRADGERVVKMLQSGESPFNGWQNWHPDPDWPVPSLPADWDAI